MVWYIMGGLVCEWIGWVGWVDGGGLGWIGVRTCLII
jgi:hypothetical protein